MRGHETELVTYLDHSKYTNSHHRLGLYAFVMAREEKEQPERTSNIWALWVLDKVVDRKHCTARNVFPPRESELCRITARCPPR